VEESGAALERGVLPGMGVPGWGAGGGRQPPPQFVGQTKTVGQYSLYSRAILAYYKKKMGQILSICGKFRNMWKMSRMILKWYTDRKFFDLRKNFFALVGQNPGKSGKFVSAPLIFSFRYAHASRVIYFQG
jgi:hypothetical protein